MQVSSKHSESNLQNELKDLEVKQKAAIEEKEKLLLEKEKQIVESSSLEKSSNLTPSDSLKLTELETRSENLEKELVKKANYIKE